MKFLSFNVEAVPADKVADLGATWISAWAEHPFGCNAFVRAWVGKQEVRDIAVDQFGLSFTGLTSEAPGPTDTLTVQIDGGDKIDTGLKVAADSV